MERSSFKPFAVAITIMTLFALIASPLFANRARADSTASLTKTICETLGRVTSSAEATIGGTTAEISGAAEQVTNVPVVDMVLLNLQGSTSGTSKGASSGSTASVCESFSEWIFKTILASIKKAILDMIVDQTISWIQGGGRPKFLTDWRGFLNQAANDAAGEFIESTPFGFLCSPFGFQVKVALLPVKNFSQQITCTLNQVISNINAFYDNFSSGGWIAYSSSQQLQNNFYGSFFLTAVEMEIKLDEAASNAEKITSGASYIGTQSCQENPNNVYAPDIDGDQTSGDIPSTCIQTVPGETIGSQVANALQLETDALMGAEDVADYINALVNAALNRLIQEGVDGLLGVITPNAPPSSFPGGPVITQNGCQGLTGAAYQSCLQYQNSAGGGASPGTATSSLISSISGAISERQQADGFLANTLSQLPLYASTTVPNFIATFQGSYCQYLTSADKTQYIADANAELSWANATYDSTRTAKT